MIKPCWTVCSMDGDVLLDKVGHSVEFASEKAALRCARKWVTLSADREAWVYRLAKVVSRPGGKPVVDEVK